MNFYKTLGLKNSRIDVADALRGLAVAGIILYHSVEHFNMYDGNIAHVYTLGCDDWMADVLALLLSGKMYGIFALLFGLSFFIMNDNQQQRGNCFSGRFAWRMFLLAMLGIVNTAFFDGDILFSYAIYGQIGRASLCFLSIECIFSQLCIFLPNGSGGWLPSSLSNR